MILELIKPADAITLETVILQYQQELLGEEKSTYQYLQSYWTEANRFPYWLRRDNQIVGFCLVNQYLVVNQSGHSIAEFYIKPEFRRQRLGSTAAQLVLKNHPGSWEVRVLTTNESGLKFWHQTIDMLTESQFQKHSRVAETIFTFEMISEL